MTFQNDVRAALRAIPKERRRLSSRSCKVTDALERPWAQRYRVVEWLASDRAARHQCVVPADLSVEQVVELLLSFVPGRRHELRGDEYDVGRRRTPEIADDDLP
jgi:hypothetical protein